MKGNAKLTLFVRATSAMSTAAIRAVAEVRLPVIGIAIVAAALGACRSSPSGPVSTGTAPSPDTATVEVIATPAVVSSDLPAAPELVQPRTAWIHGNPKEISWRPVKNADTYRVVVSRDQDLTGPLVEWTIPSSQTSPDTLLRRPLELPTQPGETLHVGIQAVSITGALSATTRVSVPIRFATPQVVQPRAGATMDAERPRFEWTAVIGASAYELEVLDDAPDAAVATILKITVPPDPPIFERSEPLARTGTLRVRVRPVGDSRPGDWSKERTFIYEPIRPRIVEPVVDEHVVSRHPLVSWSMPDAKTTPASASAEDERFEIEICAQDARGECRARFLGESSSTFYRSNEALTRGQSHRLRVRGKSDSLWSDPIVFTVRAERTHPLPITPILSRRSRHEWRSTVTPDGLLLAVASRKIAALGMAEPDSGWEITLLERDPSSAVPSFKITPGTGVTFVDPTHSLKTAASADAEFLDRIYRTSPGLDWAAGNDSAAKLYLSSPSGDVHTLSDWSTLAKLPFSIAGRVTAISAGRTLDSQPERRRRERLFLEVTRREASARDMPPTGWNSTPLATGDNAELWSVSPDGSDLRLVTIGTNPTLSPNGRALAHSVRTVDNVFEIRLLALDGSQTVTRLPCQGPLRDVRGLAWSPGGRYLAYARDLGLGFDIVVLHLDTGVETAVTGAFAPELYPQFLPSTSLDRAFDGIVFSTRAEDSRGSGWTLQFVEFRGQL